MPELILIAMENHIVNAALVQMLDILYQKDQFLLNAANNLTERSVTHRMGMYLQSIFPDLDVDCEYNRMGRMDLDTIYFTEGDYFAKTVCLSGSVISDSDDKGSRVFPDIIIHKRGTAENLIIIEVKMAWKSIESAHDIKKLNAFKNDLKYEFAFYIELTEERQKVIIKSI